jgi:hypothetical protein
MDARGRRLAASGGSGYAVRANPGAVPGGGAREEGRAAVPAVVHVRVFAERGLFVPTGGFGCVFADDLEAIFRWEFWDRRASGW